MSAIEMLSSTKFSYQRLKNEGGFEVEEDVEEIEDVSVIGRTRSWSRIKRVNSKKRSKVRIPGLRRFLKRKAKLFSVVRISWNRVLKRFKESGPHLGDLFAGNYLFMQVVPSPLKYAEKSFMGHDLHGFTSRYSIGRIA